MDKYKKQAQVEVFHAYLGGDAGGCISFVPVGTIPGLLRAGSHGFELFGSADLPASLEFKLVFRDADFWSYTEVPTEDWYYSEAGEHYLRVDKELVRISFKARAIRWEYDIISPLPLDNPGIQGFNGPEAVTLPTGQTALRFVSTELLPLSQTPRFHLVAGTLKIALPNPCPDGLPVYIYL